MHNTFCMDFPDSIKFLQQVIIFYDDCFMAPAINLNLT